MDRFQLHAAECKPNWYQWVVRIGKRRHKQLLNGNLEEWQEVTFRGVTVHCKLTNVHRNYLCFWLLGSFAECTATPKLGFVRSRTYLGYLSLNKYVIISSSSTLRTIITKHCNRNIAGGPLREMRARNGLYHAFTLFIWAWNYFSSFYPLKPTLARQRPMLYGITYTWNLK